MELKHLCSVIIVVSAVQAASALWNDLNCPAPRAPDNGLSFIFRNGELVHFRCHPGYLMVGKPVAYCVNSVWTETAPRCLPVRKWDGHAEAAEGARTTYHHPEGRHHRKEVAAADKQRQLFSWGDDRSAHHRKQSVYGDGPRRLPLINGIWPPQDRGERVLSLDPAPKTPVPRTLVKEEVDIAELRHRQLQELRRQRHGPDGDSEAARRLKKLDKKRHEAGNSVLVDEYSPRETVISLGSTVDGDALSVALAKNGSAEDAGWGKKRRRHHGKKKKAHHQAQPDNGFLIARSSRVDSSGVSPYQQRLHFDRAPLAPQPPDSVAELRHRAEHHRHRPKHRSRHDLSQLDASCTEKLFGREVPLLAPQLGHAFVYRYETGRNKGHPYNGYMRVLYRCLSGYTFENADARTLGCKDGAWVGEVPRCVTVKG